jgi:hypothetical protein
MKQSGAEPPADQPALPPRPQPPRDSDCCGSDCTLCVFTLYDRELEAWRQQVEAQRRAGGAAGAEWQA